MHTGKEEVRRKGCGERRRERDIGNWKQEVGINELWAVVAGGLWNSCSSIYHLES